MAPRDIPSSDPITKSDPIDELPNAQRNTAARLLLSFHREDDPISDDLSSQHYIGIHSRLEDAAGVDKSVGGERCIISSEQREIWYRKLLALRRLADSEDMAPRAVTALTKTLSTYDEQYAHIENSIHNLRLRDAIRQLGPAHAEEKRRAVLKRFKTFLSKNPDLAVDVLQYLSPMKDLTRDSIDILLKCAHDHQAQLRKSAAQHEQMSQELRQRLVAERALERNVEHVVQGISLLESQWMEMKDTMDVEITAAKIAQTTAEESSKKEQIALENARANVEMLEQDLKTARSDLQEAVKLRKDTQDRCFDEILNSTLLRQERDRLKGQITEQEQAASDKHNRIQRELDALKNKHCQDLSELDEIKSTLKGLESDLRLKTDEAQTHIENIAESDEKIAELKKTCVAQKAQRVIDESEIARLRREAEAQSATIDTARKKLTATNSEWTKSAASVTMLKIEKDQLQIEVSRLEEIEVERDELRQQLDFVNQWNQYLQVYGDYWKLTVDQTGNYTIDEFRDMELSLNAANEFRRALQPIDIAQDCGKLASIYVLGDAKQVQPAARLAVLSMFGRLHQRNCKISVIAMEAIAQMLQHSNLRSRRLDLMLLYAFLRKRCSMVKDNAAICSFATTLVILRCIELLHHHLTGKHLLDAVGEIFTAVRPKLAGGSLLVQALVDRVEAKIQPQQPTLAHCLLSKGKFKDVPGSDCKLSMDGDHILIVQSDMDVVCVHPSQYRFVYDFRRGFCVAFDQAPLVGTWTTPFWTYGEHVVSVSTIFKRAIEHLESPTNHAAAMATKDTWLLDVVSV